MKLNAKETVIWEALLAAGPEGLHLNALADEAGLSNSHVRNSLRKLIRNGVTAKLGRGTYAAGTYDAPPVAISLGFQLRSRQTGSDKNVTRVGKKVKKATEPFDLNKLPKAPPGSPTVLFLGGGVDSFGMLVDAINRDDKPDWVVFCDVGDPQGLDPAEWPGTYRHLRDVVIPLCDANDIKFEWLDTTRYPIRPRKAGHDSRGPIEAHPGHRSLFDWMRNPPKTRAKGKSKPRGIQVPVANKKQRMCTEAAKIERAERWMDDTFPGQTVETWLGFDAAETDRAGNDPNNGKTRKPTPGQAIRVNRYPLIEQGLCRCRCVDTIRAAGLPVPRKSACVFCPLGTKTDWITFSQELPEKFAMVAELEDAKPKTSKGVKMSIMGFTSRKWNKDADGNKTTLKSNCKGTPISEWVTTKDRTKAQPLCPICGAASKATKATGCGWQDEETAKAA